MLAGQPAFLRLALDVKRERDVPVPFRVRQMPTMGPKGELPVTIRSRA